MKKNTRFPILALIVTAFLLLSLVGCATGYKPPVGPGVVPVKQNVPAEKKSEVDIAPDYGNIPEDAKQILRNFNEAIKITTVSYHRQWNKEDQKQLDKYLKRYFPQKPDHAADTLLNSRKKQTEALGGKYFFGLKIEDLAGKNYEAYQAAIDFLEAVSPESEVNRLVTGGDVLKDTQQTFCDFVKALKRYHLQWTKEDKARLDEYLREYFPKKLDHATCVFTAEEYKSWISVSYSGVGILIGIDDKMFAARKSEMEAISQKYFPGLKMEDLAIENYEAYQAAIDFLEAVSPEYKELNRLVKNGIVGEHGAWLKDIPMTQPPSPAQKAGLTAYKGWYITNVNGKAATGRSLPDILREIKGEKDTAVKLTLKSPSGSIAKTFDIVRGPVRKNQFEYKVIPGTQIGYLKFTAFAESNPQAYIGKIAELYSRGAKGLIIDLENNPGGILRAALGLASSFLDPGKDLLYVKEHDGRLHRYGSQTTASKLFSGPVVIILNDCSASASEVLSLILREYGIASIVGIKSYGKGSVQATDPLSGGGAFKYTTSLYYSPVKKICIDGKGIEPDIVVKDELRIKINEPIEKAIEILQQKLK